MLKDKRNVCECLQPAQATSESSLHSNAGVLAEDSGLHTTPKFAGAAGKKLRLNCWFARPHAASSSHSASAGKTGMHSVNSVSSNDFIIGAQSLPDNQSSSATPQSSRVWDSEGSSHSGHTNSYSLGESSDVNSIDSSQPADATESLSSGSHRSDATDSLSPGSNRSDGSADSVLPHSPLDSPQSGQSADSIGAATPDSVPIATPDSMEIATPEAAVHAKAGGSLKPAAQNKPKRNQSKRKASRQQHANQAAAALLQAGIGAAAEYYSEATTDSAGSDTTSCNTDSSAAGVARNKGTSATSASSVSAPRHKRNSKLGSCNAAKHQQHIGESAEVQTATAAADSVGTGMLTHDLHQLMGQNSFVSKCDDAFAVRLPSSSV